ncbi:hypothetical protein HYT56_02370 [Candidatus Woesearchaeota archaeon]|nr:hypothetical protein [Candidatus Woesearchaeota archaeon]
MLKRGQTQEIFTWIFVIIVAVAILFFGIKLLKNTNELKDGVLVVKFFNDLDKKLSQYYFLDKGSSGEEKFLLPSNVEWICFVNPDSADSYPPYIEEKILINGLKGFSNVFIGPFGLYEENRFNASTKLYLTDPVCKKISNGVLIINLENEGVKDGIAIK